jgi:hypothetical protein
MYRLARGRKNSSHAKLQCQPVGEALGVLLTALRENGMDEAKVREVEAGLLRARERGRVEVTTADERALAELAADISRIIPEREVPKIFALAGLKPLRAGEMVDWVLVFLKHFPVVASHLMAAPEESHSWEGRERQAVRGYTQQGSSIRFEGVPGDELCATGWSGWASSRSFLSCGTSPAAMPSPWPRAPGREASALPSRSTWRWWAWS